MAFYRLIISRISVSRAKISIKSRRRDIAGVGFSARSGCAFGGEPKKESGGN